MKPHSVQEAVRAGYELGTSMRENNVSLDRAREQIRYMLPSFIGALWDGNATSITDAYWDATKAYGDMW